MLNYKAHEKTRSQHRRTKWRDSGTSRLHAHGQDERGWKGEVGAYVYSCRTSKILKVYPVKDATAHEATETLKDYLANVKPYIKKTITCIQTDAGSQFAAKEWVSACASNGLKDRSCPVDHQEMNGQVERMIGILATKMRSLLGTMEVPRKYWPLAIVTAAYTLNRTPSEALGGRTPLEAGTGVKPDLRKMKVFGCKAYVQIPKPQRRGKLNPTAWQGMLVGYSTNSPEWIILDMRTNNLRKAYSVVFLEDERGVENWGEDRTKIGEYEVPMAHKSDDCESAGNNNNSEDTSETVQCWAGQQRAELEITTSESPISSPTNSLSEDGDSDSSWEGDGDNKGNEQKDHCLRRNVRMRRQFNPNYMPSGTSEMEKLSKQIEDDSTSSEDEESESATDESETLENSGLCLALQMRENNLGLCMAMTMTEELPRSWKQAVNVNHWKEAMEKEINELQEKGAWILVDRKVGMNVLPGVWNYRTKRDENGEIVKYKARWYVNGAGDKFTWPPEAIYSPVAEISTVRLMFAAAAATGQVVLQADFPNAYLNAEMKEEVYVCQPYGVYCEEGSNKVCLLKKALYGSPISGKRWHDEITEKITELGYKRSAIDHCLFTREAGGHTDLLVIYMDDLLVASSGGKERAESQLDELEQVYDIKRLGKAAHMLGIGVHQGDGYITLEQGAYVDKILSEMEFEGVKPRGTPWDHQYVGKDDLLDVTHTTLFRRVLGQLMYLSNCTRRDVSFAVGRLASHMKTPCQRDWERIKRLLRYIKGTKGYGLTYTRQDKFPML